MMDRIIEQLTTEAVRDQLDQVVKELVAELRYLGVSDEELRALVMEREEKDT